MNVLIVETAERVASFLSKGLRAHGYTVEWVSTGREALRRGLGSDSSLMVLDLGLPDLDGLDVLATLRKCGYAVPVLALSAGGQVEDRVRALDLGADDCLVKPFALEELLARVKALLRRHNPPDIAREILHFEDLELDTATRQARRGTRTIELSTTEYELLAMFLRNPRIVLTRTVLMDRIWGNDFEGGPNVLEVYIGHLRSKLEQHGEKRLIQTVRGAGYVLRAME